MNRRDLLTALAAAPLAGCATVLPAASSPRALKLVTYNIWHNQGDWAARRPVLFDLIRAESPDAVFLQEVLEDAAVGLPNQAFDLAASLGGDYRAFFCSTDAEGAPRRYGNAIVTRLPVLAHDWKKLEPLDDYRTALRVRVDLGGRPVDLVDTHLAWQENQAATRATQIADLLAWLPGDRTPLIVAGDFNAVQADPGLAVLTSPRFVSALPRDSVPTTLNPAMNHPARVIDHIFAQADRFTASGAHLIGDRPVGGVHASDHFGVAATLTLR